MKKLRVSKGDKVILGICGGIGETFGLNSNLVRLLFVLSIFVGSAGFWIYLTLTVILPKEKSGEEIIEIEPEGEKRKIQRVWDNRMLGGVCAGIAKYFGWDVTLVRLVFVGMTMAGGVGAILYLFFWFIFPSEE